MSATTYNYVAFDNAGAQHRGVTSATTQAEAFRNIAALGLTPVSLAPGKASAREARVSLRELSIFTQQLGVLLQARIPVTEGLIGIAEQEQGTPLQALCLDLARRIDAGESIASAMAAHQETLGEVYVETVRAAEQTGNLISSLEHLGEMIERREETTRQVRGALMYPACVLGVLAAAVVFLVGFVVPKFAHMFAKRGAELPILTEALLAAGKSMQGYWWAYLVVLVAAIVLARPVAQKEGVRRAIEALAFRVPYLNRMLEALVLSRFCRVLGVGLSSGLGLIESLGLARAAAGSQRLTADVDHLVTALRTGGSLAAALRTCSFISSFAVRLLAAGERGGEIPHMCGVISRHYDREVTSLTKNISTVIEPVLIVLIASVVLIIALAVFLPMWDMVTLMGG
ncbi:MAG: type II secretion system F family protein [Planctomycetota bacterium]|nr:type II secretion system F family protein [Planctomycetota bacterium]